MTTSFEIASAIDSFQANGISPVVDPYSVYNSLGHAPAVRPPASAVTSVTRVDTANFSEVSSIAAAALSDSTLQTQRIIALRQSIANGTYRISSRAIAQSILNASLTEL